MKREYNIDYQEALFKYTEDQIQQMLSDLPVERVVHFYPGMSNMEMNNRYLECFMDRDITKVSNAYEKAVIIERRAELKAQLKNCKDLKEKEKIENEIRDITDKINKE